MSINTKYKYINSKDIKVFPCANRSVNIESKLNTEFNFTHIPSVAGLANCILNNPNSDSRCEFIINSYYFSVNNSEIPTDWDNVYAVIALEEIDLVTGNEGYTENSTILSEITHNGSSYSHARPGSTLDDDNGQFKGLLLVSDEPSSLSTAYKFLQLKASTNIWTNVGPLLKATKLNGLTLSGSKISGATKLNGTNISTNNNKLILGSTTTGETRVAQIYAESLDVNTTTTLTGTLNGTSISKDSAANKLILGSSNSLVQQIYVNTLSNVTTLTMSSGTISNVSKINGLTLSNSTEISGATKLIMSSGEISGVNTVDNVDLSNNTIGSKNNPLSVLNVKTINLII